MKTEKTIYESPLRKVVLPAVLPLRPVDKMNELIEGLFQIIYQQRNRDIINISALLASNGWNESETQTQ